MRNLWRWNPKSAERWQLWPSITGGLIGIPFFKTAKLHDFKKKNKGYATQNGLKHIKDNRDCWDNIYWNPQLQLQLKKLWKDLIEVRATLRALLIRTGWGFLIIQHIWFTKISLPLKALCLKNGWLLGSRNTGQRPIWQIAHILPKDTLRWPNSKNHI